MDARCIVRVLAFATVGALGLAVATVGMAVAAPTSSSSELVDVRVARHATFDRIVFEFNDVAPGDVTAAWESPPIIQDPSGLEVPVDGNAFLRIRMAPASAFASADGAPTYHGPDRIALSGGNVVEVVKTGDFEAVMSWVAGVNTKARFTVTTGAAPARVIVDVEHSAPPASAVTTDPRFTG
jgi:hypothetical protein